MEIESSEQLVLGDFAEALLFLESAEDTRLLLEDTPTTFMELETEEEI